MVNRYLTRDANAYHNKVDPLARARSEAMNGTYRVLHSGRGRNDRARFNDNGILIPSASIRRRARNIIQSGDRKSTRLNSSHVAISSAVFCSKYIDISDIIV